MTKNKIESYKFLSIKNIVLILLVVLFLVFLYVMLKAHFSMQYSSYLNKYKVGMICDDDVRVFSSVDIVDKEKTEEKKRESSASVVPVFSFSPQKTIETIKLMDSFLTNGKEMSNFENFSGLVFYDNIDKDVLSIAYELTHHILSLGYFNSLELEKLKQDGYSSICVINNYLSDDRSEKTIQLSDELITEKNINDYVVKKLNKDYGKDDSYEVFLISGIVQYFCRINVFFDQVITESRKQEAYSNTEPVLISLKKGELLLQKNTVVTASQLQTIETLENSNILSAHDIISITFFDLVSVCLVFWVLMYFLHYDKLQVNTFLIITTVVICFLCVAIYFIEFYFLKFVQSFLYGILPVCFLSLFLTMLSGKRKIGCLGAVITAIVIHSVPESTFYSFFYCIIVGVASSYVVMLYNRRLDMFFQWLIVTAISVLCTIILMYFEYVDISLWATMLIGCVVQVAVIHVILSILVPITERIFNIPTSYRLRELAYSDSQLLERLAQSAPGTYNHCRAVADLAEKACAEIHANALLARVGALYHDIGKIEHPEYFVENQDGDNKHDDLNPGLSVSIIKNHVKVGAEMAKTAGLPLEVIDIIANHHGNDVIQYFYNEAIKQADGEEKISSIDYSYNNSKIPESKECAVVMFADSIEAAARTIQEPNIAKFSKLIESIVLGKINRGQLKNCIISMNEISIICDSFLFTLSAQYHSRIEYTDENDK